MSSARIDKDRRLQPGDTFRSDGNNYALVFQPDGNFVLYDNSNGNPVWSSNTASDNIQGRTVVVQGDGNVVMYEGDGTAIWASGSNYEASNPYLLVQDDGNLCLYDDNVEGCHWNIQ